MELDLTFDGFCFGKINLPEVKTSIWGAKVPIEGQRIHILDMTTYKSFVRSLMVNDETRFQLENGVCTIKSLGIIAHCNYCLDIPIRGMSGPKFNIKNAERNGKEVILTLIVHNPSPVEIDHGACIFDLRNTNDESLMELRGNLKIVRGDFEVVLRGKSKKGVIPTDKARLVGTGVEGKSWCRETIQYLDVMGDLDHETTNLLRG